jgi:two-component system nitrogen regulation response regulator NtrX
LWFSRVAGAAAEEGHVMEGGLGSLTERSSVEREGSYCPGVIGRDPQLLAALSVAERAAEDGECTVLITGETGTGKELVAHSIHGQGRRKGRPFTALNSASLPTELAESLLFGHERGAYTDATTSTQGIFHATRGGTVFLDEIQELDLRVQAKLLRFLQDHRVSPLGRETSHPVDVRIIAGSNQDLEAAVGVGAFRPDLYFRLNVVPIHLPPLRERPDDIPLLIDHFLVEFGAKKGRRITIAPQALAALTQYTWPGNVRELRNLIERLVILCPSDTVYYQDLPSPLFPDSCPDFCAPLRSENNLKRAKEQLIEAFERDFIYRHWAANAWHIGNTAKEIGESREWLGKQIRKYGLKRGHGDRPG